MSKLFEPTVLSPHELMARATGLEPAASYVTGKRSKNKRTMNYAATCAKCRKELQVAKGVLSAEG
jgi:hypothetical protein